MSLSTVAGNFVSNLGGALNLPEFGLSERINSIGSQPTAWNTNNPVNNQIQAVRSSGVSVTPNNIGQVLGVSTGAIQGPGNDAGIAEWQANRNTGGSTPAPAPSGFNQFDRNANPGSGYFWDAADGWKPIQDSGVNTDMMSYINSEFDNIIGSLSPMQQEEQGFITNAQNLQKQGINDQLQFGQQNVEAQRGKVNENQANTLADLAKSLRDSSRNVRMMLGARGATGSANDAAAYALTKLYGNQRAGVQQQSSDQLFQLDMVAQNLQQSASQMLNDVDTWANSQMGDIAARYNQLRQQWNAMRGEARLQAVADLQARRQAVEDQKRQYQMQIQGAAQQRLMQLNDMMATFNNQALMAPQQQVFQEFGFSPTQQTQEDWFNPMARYNNRKKELGF